MDLRGKGRRETLQMDGTFSRMDVGETEGEGEIERERERGR